MKVGFGVSAVWAGMSMVALGGCSSSPAPADAGSASDAFMASGEDAPLTTDSGGASRCGGPSSTYPAGTTTVAMLDHDGQSRSFRVHVPPGYDGSAPVPIVFVFHGGGGSGEQVELRSSGMSDIADREGFIAVYADGTGTIRTWNAGGCCGSAVRDDVDDVGFVRALLDHLESELCIDPARVHATGMSNGAMLTHRLACELSDRFASVAPIAGVEMAPACPTNGRVALMQVHGSSDGHVPWEGGVGCGPAGVAFTSVPETMSRWRMRNGCEETSSPLVMEGDGTCVQYDGCDADVALCTIEGGGHSWPGGEPNRDVVDCPADGEQSTTFRASEQIWSFFEAHPRR